MNFKFDIRLKISTHSGAIGAGWPTGTTFFVVLLSMEMYFHGVIGRFMKFRFCVRNIFVASWENVHKVGENDMWDIAAGNRVYSQEHFAEKKYPDSLIEWKMDEILYLEVESAQKFYFRKIFVFWLNCKILFSDSVTFS